MKITNNNAGAMHDIPTKRLIVRLAKPEDIIYGMLRKEWPDITNPEDAPIEYSPLS